MFRCPNCGNRLVGRAMFLENFMCSRCRARLRVTPSGAPASLFFIMLLGGLIALAFAMRFSFFIFLLLLLSFGRIAPNLLTKVEVVQQSTLTSHQTQSVRSRPTVPRNDANRQNRLNGQPSPIYGNRAWKYCVYCGATVSPGEMRFCTNCGASLPTPIDESPPLAQGSARLAEGYTGNCMVCGLSLHPADTVTHCPHCGNAAHKVHLIEWIHVRGQCPICGQHMNERDVS